MKTGGTYREAWRTVLRPGVQLAVGYVAGLFLLSGCSPKMDIQVIRYPDVPVVAAAGSTCNIKMFDEYAKLPNGCVDIGDVFVGDTGWSTECEQKRVESELKAVACRVGANALLSWRVPEPDSTCYQMRARLLTCASDPSAAESNTAKHD